jgi:putative redox protein
MDKSRELETTLVLLNERVHFHGTVEGNDPVSIDYMPPVGDNLGYTSLELLLLSLSSCVGSAVLTFLRRMRKNISQFEIKAHGIRRTEHPISFSKITLEIRMQSPDVTKEDVAKVIAMAEEKYCPVWDMIRGNVPVEIVSVITN